jgi:hypothetical protein
MWPQWTFTHGFGRRIIKVDEEGPHVSNVRSRPTLPVGDIHRNAHASAATVQLTQGIGMFGERAMKGAR